MKGRFEWLTVVVLAVVPHARAQDAAVGDVAAGYSHLQILKGYTISMDGATGAVALDVNRWVAIVADLGIYHGHPGESLTGETYAAGPRVSYRGFDRIVPFAQVVAGGSHFNASSGGITGGRNEFAWGLGAGADFVLAPRGNFAVRPQIDYFGIHSQGSETGSARGSIAIVYRFGGS